MIEHYSFYSLIKALYWRYRDNFYFKTINILSPWLQFGIQDAASPIIEEIISLHDFVNFILVFIITFVAYIITTIVINSFINKNLLENQYLEYIWTIIPALILSQIAGPSLILLYLLDEAIEATLTIKAIGHQWYWSYEYTDFWSVLKNKTLEFDSYIIPRDSLDSSRFRLLDVDNRTIVRYNTHVRILISSSDVLHAWTIPALGVKVDAVPGRLNQLKFICQRPGIFYGQCSEICGANHRFIPIVLEAIKAPDFLAWVISQINE